MENNWRISNKKIIKRTNLWRFKIRKIIKVYKKRNNKSWQNNYYKNWRNVKNRYKSL
jgi:hypothetical protein